MSDSITNISINVIGDAIQTFESIEETAFTAFTGIETGSLGASAGLEDVAIAGENADTILSSISTEGNIANTSLQSLGEAAAMAGIDINTLGTEMSIEEIAASAERAGIDMQSLGEAASMAGINITSLGTEAENTAAKEDQMGLQGEEAASNISSNMMMATAAIGMVTAGMEEYGQQTEDTQAKISQLAIQTNMADGDARNLIVSLTSADFPTADAEQYISTLSQMGVPNDKLKQGAEAFNEMNQATGVGSGEIQKFSNSLVVMGVPLDDIPSSFNAIGYAQANVVGGFGTYINWMQKYDSTFKSMGLNVDQTAVLVSAATKKFGGGRAAYSGLNDAMKESGGNLTVLEQKLGMQPGSLTNASQATAAYSGKVEESAKAEADHKTFLQQIQGELSKLSAQYGDSFGQIASFGGMLGSVGMIITGVASAHSLLTSAKSADTAATVANDAATEGGIVAKITDAASTVAGTVAKGASTVATGAMTAAQWALNAAMDANPIGVIIVLIMLLVGGLLYLWNTNEGFRNAVMGAWSAISGAVMPVLQAIYGGLQWLWGGLQWIWNLLTGWATGVGNSANQAGSSFITWIINWFTQLPGMIWNFLLMALLQVGLWEIQLGTYVLNAVMNFLNVVRTYLTQLPGLIWTFLLMALLQIGIWELQLINYGINAGSQFINSVLNYIRQLPGQMWSLLLSILSYMASWVSMGASYARNAGSQIVNNIRSFMSNLPGQMYQWGINMFDQFINAIINSIPGLRQALGAVSALFPHSPPKEGPLSTIKPENMEKFGSTLTGAMNTGLKDGAGDAFGFISANPSTSKTTLNNSSSSDGTQKLEVTLIHDFKNVPSGLDKETLLNALKGMTYDLGWIDTLIKTLSYGKVITKANLGA